jgi:hypothetical protein
MATTERVIKTAAEHHESIRKHRAKISSEKYQEKMRSQREEDRRTYGEALRDDIMSLVANSGMSFEQIEGKGGPVIATLMKWYRKEVKFPQMGTAQAICRAIGARLVVERIGG